MKDLQEFKESLKSDNPNEGLSVQLKALWYDGKGDWDNAHHQVDHLNDRQSAHIHAYLHRKEGDVWNADYWYIKAGQNRPQFSLEQEWDQLVLLYLTAH